MARVFETARFPGGVAPAAQQYPVTAAQTFIKGAIVIFDSGTQGNIIEASANPTQIVGVALEGAFTRPGNQVSFDSAVVARTGPYNVINVAQANRQTVFSGRGVNGATDPVTTAQTYVGLSYGILRTSAGEWVVNIADAVVTRVKIIDIETSLNLFFFKFLDTAMATP